jgi:ferrous iron transport protein B
MGVMYGADELEDAGLVAEEGSEEIGDTILQRALQRSITPAAALAFMIFILLYFPCVATFVAIKNETNSWRWAIYSAIYTIILAWVMAFITYRLALLFF